MIFLIAAVLFAGFNDSFQPAFVTLAVSIVVSNCTAQETKKKARPLWKVLAFRLVPIIGFELMTYRLQGGCSTN